MQRDQNKLCSSQTYCQRVFIIELPTSIKCPKAGIEFPRNQSHSFYRMSSRPSSPPYRVTGKLCLVVRSSRLIHLIVAFTPSSKLPPNEDHHHPPSYPKHLVMCHICLDGTWSAATPTTTTILTDNIFPPGSLSALVHLWSVEAFKSAPSHTHTTSCVCLQP